MSRKSAKKAAGKSDDARPATGQGQSFQPSADAESPRNPVIDAIGNGLVTLGQKVNRRGLDPGRI